MSKLMQSILTDAEVRGPQEVENAALSEKAMEPWQ
jgi:hypothetical protein